MAIASPRIGAKPCSFVIGDSHATPPFAGSQPPFTDTRETRRQPDRILP